MTRKSAKLQGRSKRVVMGSGASLRRDTAKQSEPSSITGLQKLLTMLLVPFPAGPIFADLKLLSLFDQAIFRVFLINDQLWVLVSSAEDQGVM